MRGDDKGFVKQTLKWIFDQVLSSVCKHCNYGHEN